MKEYILFESNPDFSCNTFLVFEELKKQLPNYKFIWVTNNSNSIIPKNVDIVVNRRSSYIKRIKYLYYLSSCRVMVSSNQFFRKLKNEQINLFLCHGSKTKKTKGTYEMGNEVDYINVQSHFFDDIISYEYNCDKSQLVYLGYPRCDYFYQNKNIARNCLFKNKNAKFIIWLPTFRKHNNGKIDALNSKYNDIGIPLIYTIDMLQNFNEYLKKNNIYIVYKPHPVQDISSLVSFNLSNILIICDQFLAEKRLQLYEVIAESEALITDYSSVFFDYLLLDRPIATTTDDIENWKNGRGFAFDIEGMYNKASVRIPDILSLQQFISNVIRGKDNLKYDRKEVCDLTNIYKDGNSSKRVCDFILKKLDEEN